MLPVESRAAFRIAITHFGVQDFAPAAFRLLQLGDKTQLSGFNTRALSKLAFRQSSRPPVGHTPEALDAAQLM